MKKATSLWNAFLNKAKRRSRAETEDAQPEGKTSQSVRSEDEVFKIIKIFGCSRCVLICDIKIWRQCTLAKIFNAEDLSDADAALTAAGETIEATRSLLGFYGLEPNNEPKYSAAGSVAAGRDWCELVHNRLRCLLEHSRSLFHTGLTFDSHCPSFVWITVSTGQWSSPIIYEDFDVVLFKLSLAILCSLVGISVPMSLVGAATNVDVWALLRKFPRPAVSLAMEEDLNTMVLDQSICMAFLSLPSTMEERFKRLEAIMQAVDDIMDIASYISLVGDDEAGNQSTVREVIMETATVVTSTAAESTATVGIETAAMALGQAAAGIAISVLVDIALTAGSVTRAKLQRDKGLISKSQFKATVGRRLCDSGCQFIGGTTGTIVGQVLIPVPVLGAIVGGFCGSLIGVGVSKGIIKTSEIISKAQANRTKALTNK